MNQKELYEIHLLSNSKAMDKELVCLSML